MNYMMNAGFLFIHILHFYNRVIFYTVGTSIPKVKFKILFQLGAQRGTNSLLSSLGRGSE